LFMKRMFQVGTVAAALTLGLLGTAHAEDTLKKIKDSGSVTMGVRESSGALAFTLGDGKYAGFHYDVCQRVLADIQKQLGMAKIDIKYQPVTSQNRIPLVQNGTVDLECGSTTNNADRQKQVSFAPTHFLTASRFVTKKASNIKTIDDLKGKTVVSTAGTTNIKQLNDANTEKKLGINIIPAKDHAEAFLMVETDRAVAFVMDDILLASLVAGSKEPAAYVIPEAAFSLPEPYGIMLRREDPAFKKLVDQAVGDFYKSAEGKANYDKWFTKPIPPKNLNLNVPMSAALKKVYDKPTDSPDPAMY